MKSIVNSTRIYKSNVSHNDNALLKQYLYDFNSAKHLSFCLLKKETELPTSLHLYIKNKYQFDDYLTNSAIREAKALLKAQKQLQKYYLKMNKKKIIHTEKEIQKHYKEIDDFCNCLQKIRIASIKHKDLKLPKKYNKFVHYYQGKFQVFHNKKHIKTLNPYDYELYLKQQIHNLKNRNHMLSYRLNRLYQKQENLSHSLPSLVFGSKKLFKSQYTRPRNSWYQEFYHKRNYQMQISGRCDAKQGNFVFHYQNDEVTIKLGKQHISVPCDFPFMKGELQEALLQPQATAWSIINKGRYYLLQAVITLPEKAINYCTSEGTVGIDINVNHIALSETDNKGNMVHQQVFPYDLKHKTTNQRNHILRNVIKQVMQVCVDCEKPLIMENLDTEDSKVTLAYSNKRRNQQFSEFAYQKITDFIHSRAYKDNVYVKMVNPAYTSQIGKMKYMKQKGLSIHIAASYVIARRGMNYKEKVPSALMNDKLKHLNEKAQWNYLTKMYKHLPVYTFYNT